MGLENCRMLSVIIPPTKGEVLALIWFLTHYWYFLLARPFIVRSDNAALQWLKNFKSPTGMILRWLETLAEYQFEVRYRPGSKHTNADSLSRVPHAPLLVQPEDNLMREKCISVAAINLLQVGEQQLARWINARLMAEEQRKDSVLKDVCRWVCSNRQPDKEEMARMTLAHQAYY